MFAIKDGERLYLKNWEYNLMLTLNRLSELVSENGGRVKPAKRAVISNRTLSLAIEDCNMKLRRIEEMNLVSGWSQKREDAIQTLRARIWKLEQIDNAPIETWGQSWIDFVLNDVLYKLSFDDNPFFPINYIKTPLDANGKYSSHAAYDTFDRSWMNDQLMSMECSDTDRSVAAEAILKTLVLSKFSRNLHRRPGQGVVRCKIDF